MMELFAKIGGQEQQNQQYKHRTKGIARRHDHHHHPPDEHGRVNADNNNDDDDNNDNSNSRSSIPPPRPPPHALVLDRLVFATAVERVSNAVSSVRTAVGPAECSFARQAGPEKRVA